MCFVWLNHVFLLFYCWWLNPVVFWLCAQLWEPPWFHQAGGIPFLRGVPVTVQGEIEKYKNMHTSYDLRMLDSLNFCGLKSSKIWLIRKSTGFKSQQCHCRRNLLTWGRSVPLGWFISSNFGSKNIKCKCWWDLHSPHCWLQDGRSHWIEKIAKCLRKVLRMILLHSQVDPHRWPYIQLEIPWNPPILIKLPWNPKNWWVLPSKSGGFSQLIHPN